MRMCYCTLVAAALFIVSGCAKKPPPPATEPVAEKPRVQLFTQADQNTQADAVPPQEYLIQLLTYKITVPANSVSRSDDFWKHVDEHAVDVGTYDLLFKNGVRVGVAPSAEWDYLKTVLNQNPAITQPSAYAGREARNIDLEMKLKVAYQNLFYYDSTGELVGRTFERCDNLVRVSFEPAPRKPGAVRLALCPIVRSLREAVVPVGDINTTTYQFIHPEKQYDLNLTADVPLDGFLVVAPSSEAKWPTSLGNTFLMGEGPAEQTETLLVFRPIVFRQRNDPKNALNAKP